MEHRVDHRRDSQRDRPQLVHVDGPHDLRIGHVAGRGRRFQQPPDHLGVNCHSLACSATTCAVVAPSRCGPHDARTSPARRSSPCPGSSGRSPRASRSRDRAATCAARPSWSLPVRLPDGRLQRRSRRVDGVALALRSGGAEGGELLGLRRADRLDLELTCRGPAPRPHGDRRLAPAGRRFPRHRAHAVHARAIQLQQQRLGLTSTTTRTVDAGTPARPARRGQPEGWPEFRQEHIMSRNAPRVDWSATSSTTCSGAVRRYVSHPEVHHQARCRRSLAGWIDTASAARTTARTCPRCPRSVRIVCSRGPAQRTARRSQRTTGSPSGCGWSWAKSVAAPRVPAADEHDPVSNALLRAASGQAAVRGAGHGCADSDHQRTGRPVRRGAPPTSPSSVAEVSARSGAPISPRTDGPTIRSAPS